MARLRSHKNIDGVIVLFLILLILKMIGGGIQQHPPRNPNGEENGFVQIEGDIKYPGVYGFKSKTHLRKLIRKAGGLQPSPQIHLKEMASRFSSGERIVVRYDRGTYSFYKQEMPSFYKITLGIPILLNEESEAGLTAIPGIGPHLAGNIVNMRSLKGGFKNLDELLTIKGINHRLYHKIKSFLKIRVEKSNHED
jgi:DNA uptake protein ComE-like DNA-binding protein